ncbi:MAG: JAB domain-containing protein [Lysinibacillus sp.]
MTEEKKQPKKRIQLVDVVLERKGSKLFEGRRVRSPEDAANIISDREKFVVLDMLTKNEPQLLQVVHTGSINAFIVHPREVMKALNLVNCAGCIVLHNHTSNDTTT